MSKQETQQIIQQLTRIANTLENQTPIQISQEQALQAWGQRIYQQEYLDALQRIGITIN